MESIQKDGKIRRKLLRALQRQVVFDEAQFTNTPYLTEEPSSDDDFLIFPLDSPRFCPYCLLNDQVPYFRDAWFFKPFCVCPTHNCLLLDSCPNCNAPILFWNTGWSDAITHCYNCHKEIYGNTSGVLHLGKPDFCDLLEEVPQKACAQGNLSDKFDFFRQLWRFICRDGRNTIFTNLPSNVRDLPVETLFGAVLSGLRIANKDLDKINIECHKEIDIELQNFQEEKAKNIDDPDIQVAIERAKAIAPLLNHEHLTLDLVTKQAHLISYKARTLYLWMERYRAQGIEGLIPRHEKSGRKRKQLPLKIDQEIELMIREYIRGGEQITIQELYDQVIEKAKETGIPSLDMKYGTFRKRVWEMRKNTQRITRDRGYIVPSSFF